MSQKICLVGGGTGGHIMPILSLIAHLSPPRERFFWIGWNNSMEQEKSTEAGIRFIPITTFKLASTKSLGVFLYPFKLVQGILEARNVLSRERPRLVFSKGWPGSVAVGIAAWSLGIPLYIHESDTVPGFSNKVLGYFATQIFLGFEEARKYFPKGKATVVGQILHPQFFEKNPDGKIEWKTNKKHIFVSCGSQGSRKIFQTLLKQRKQFSKISKNNLSKTSQKQSNSSANREPEWGVQLYDEWGSGDLISKNAFFRSLDTEWIVSLGTLNRSLRSEFEKWEDTQVFDWIPQSDIPHILDGTDIAITRASATTLAELSTRPIHLMIIPLALSAGGHQVRNAQVYEKNGHTVVLEEDLEKRNVGDILRSSHRPIASNTKTIISPILRLFEA